MRALNRATLARQWLLERREVTVPDALVHLVGMQSQAPNAPYVGLWTRLVGFDPTELATLMEERAAVRASLMRATLHLVTAEDCLALRPAVQRVLEQQFRGSPAPALLDGVDVAAVVAAGRDLLAEEPCTRAQLRPLLSARWPGVDAEALTYAVSYLAPLVHVTPRGVWGRTGPAALTAIGSWLGREPGRALPPEQLVRRYLAAFGPASVMDAQAWSGLTRLGEVVDRLGADVVRLRDEDGRELLDLADGPRPGADVPAPVRFLPEYDNVQFGHADRRRILPEGRTPPLPPGNGAATGTVLVDGWVAGEWRVVRAGRGGAPGRPARPGDGPVHLDVRLWERAPGAAVDDLTREGAALLALVAPGADASDVRFG
jgi:hypothetical protein